VSRLLFAALWLAGCAVTPEPAEPLLRNPSAPVGSQTDATLARLAGDWVVVEGAGLRPGTPLRFDARQVTLGDAVIPVTALGQGRFALGSQEVWIHWLDADNRTAALGDRAGTRVWIMDRKGYPAERLRAAREILDWYGYDLDLLDRT